MDDVILLPALIALTVKFIPQEKLDECREKASGMWEKGRPSAWYYSIPMIIIWVVIIGILIKIFSNYFVTRLS